MLIVALWIRLSSKGSAIFWTDCTGINNTILKMAKFRITRIDLPQIAPHLMKDSERVLERGAYLNQKLIDQGYATVY